MKLIAVGMSARLLAHAIETQALIDAVKELPAQKAEEPIKIPRSMRCTFKNSWEDTHPNDDWRGRGNKKRRMK